MASTTLLYFDALGLVADSKMRNVATIQSSAVSEVIAVTVEAGIEWHAIFAVAKLIQTSSRIQIRAFSSVNTWRYASAQLV